MKSKQVSCSWKRECENYNKLCYKCKWNADNKLGNYLLIRTGDKTLKFLESNE